MKTKLLLGERVYKTLLPSLPEPVASPHVKYRFVRGEVVGRQLTPGQGKEDLKKKTMEPAMCQHPDSAMKARGNQAEKWWLCTQCCSRWERKQLGYVMGSQEQDPQDLDLVTFGKHMGAQYLEVYQTDPVYCRWVLQTMEEGDTSEALVRLAKYIYNKKIAETYEADGYVIPGPNQDMETDSLEPVL